MKHTNPHTLTHSHALGYDTRYCPCNRMVISAMVTAMDDVIANITTALEQRGMWQDTVCSPF